LRQPFVGMADQLDAVAAGQAQVDQQHVGLQRVQEASAFGHVAGNTGQAQIARAAHGFGESLAKARIVFDDENRVGHSRAVLERGAVAAGRLPGSREMSRGHGTAGHRRDRRQRAK